jgi:site-specific recombinase XerD
MPGKQTKNSESYVEKSETLDFSIAEKIISGIKNERDNLVFSLILHTGCTPNELVNLKKESFDFQDCSVRINGVRIVLPEALCLKVNKFAQEQGFIFTSIKSPQLRQRSVTKIFLKYSKKIGTKITSTKLRRLHILNSPQERLPIKRFDRKELITSVQFSTFLSHVRDNTHRLIVKMLFSTGIKLNELTRIRVHDIEFTQNSLSVSGEKSRQIALSQGLALQIKSFVEERELRPEAFLFSSRENNFMTEKRIFQIIKQYSLESSIKVNPKILRNSFIANSFAQKIPVEELSRITGIRNIEKFHLYGSLR